MTDILVRPQELRQTAQQLRASAKKISDATGSVGKVVLGSALSLVFSGNRASALMQRYRAKEGELAAFDDLVVKFANDLEQAANRFEQADNLINQQNSSIPKGMPFGGNWDSVLENIYYSSKNYLDIMATFMESRSRFKSMLGILGMSKSYGFFKDGIPYRGTIDSLFRPLKNNNHWLFGISFVLDTAEDLYHGTYGDNYLKAIGVNLLDTGMHYAMSLNPYTGAALLINGAVQLVGNLTLGIERTQSNFIAADDITRGLLNQQLDLRAEALDKMNLGNVTKSLSESICDGFLFTESGREGLANTAKSAVNIVDGAVDSIVSGIGYQFVSAPAAHVNKIAQELPISDDLKQGISATSKQIISTTNDVINGFTKLFDWR